VNKSFHKTLGAGCIIPNTIAKIVHAEANPPAKTLYTLQMLWIQPIFV
jgi:hypothetical protein